MSKLIRCSALAAVAVALGLTGSAQAGPLNIWSASTSPEATTPTPTLEQVQYRRHYRHRDYPRHRYHRHYRYDNDFPVGAAIAAGTLGLAAGAAIASQPRYYYDEPSYYQRRSYDYCNPPNRPDHYPAPAGC